MRKFFFYSYMELYFFFLICPHLSSGISCTFHTSPGDRHLPRGPPREAGDRPGDAVRLRLRAARPPRLHRERRAVQRARDIPVRSVHLPHGLLRQEVRELRRRHEILLRVLKCSIQRINRFQKTIVADHMISMRFWHPVCERSWCTWLVTVLMLILGGILSNTFSFCSCKCGSNTPWGTGNFDDSSCRQSNTSAICSGRGTCTCGECTCNERGTTGEVRHCTCNERDTSREVRHCTCNERDTPGEVRTWGQVKKKSCVSGDITRILAGRSVGLFFYFSLFF